MLAGAPSHKFGGCYELSSESFYSPAVATTGPAVAATVDDPPRAPTSAPVCAIPTDAAYLVNTPEYPSGTLIAGGLSLHAASLEAISASAPPVHTQDRTITIPT